MMCDEEKLAGLVRGELGAEEARAVEAHAEGCAECAEELRWLRAEQKLFAARTRPAVPAHAWQGIERRVVLAREGRAHRRRTWVGVGAMGTFAAAAATLILWVHRPLHVAINDAGAPAAAPVMVAEPAAATLDRAEQEYSRAIEVLDADWQTRRGAVPAERAKKVDRDLSRLKELMNENKAIAGADVEGRRRALRTYSAYMRTVQAAVLEEQP
ncbi:MAG TPA: zf-HC2 domain-containing protein [Haliangiales bacterium]|nr:zf-HC2 domain-containing protein [Haliangiales bacterium]